MTKQEHISKKTWSKPELRVLCRGESEENVLGGCKDNNQPGHGPTGNKCRKGKWCEPCNVWGIS